MLESLITGAMIFFLFFGAFKAFFFCVFSLIFVLYPFTVIGFLLLVGVVYYLFERRFKYGSKSIVSDPTESSV